MKYQVSMKCGHTEDHELFGPYKQRERRMAWLHENHVCMNCYVNSLRDRYDCKHMKYRDYKYELEHGACIKVIPGSYNEADKTVEVYEIEEANGEG